MSKSRSRKARPPQKPAGFQRFLTLPWLVAGGAAIIVVVVFAIASRPDQSFDIDLSVIPDNSVGFPSQGGEHITLGTPHVAYNSNPPTSGPHTPDPARTAVYTRQLPDETLVHNLEHGHIWLSYRDPNDQEAIDVLSEIQRQYPRLVVVTLRPENDTRIAAAAWQRLLTLDEVDRDQILAFIARYSNKSPETVPG